ncbi:MAG TPA: nucleoside kinase [Bacilli bacterium]|nr:nucleoside kinase [Bacilli bacterium]
MFKLQVNQETKTFQEKVKLIHLINDPEKEYFVALVNNRIRELSYEVSYDATIEFLNTKHPEAVSVYETSLRYLVAMAFKNIYPDFSLKFNYSISRSIFCRITNLETQIDMKNIVNNLMQEMTRLVNLDLPFVRKVVPNEEAIEFYKENNYSDKIDIIAYRPEKNVHFYTCNGYTNYMYGYMVPSTGYLKHYILRPYHPGILIQYPRAESNGTIPIFEDAPVYGRTLKDASKWADICDASNIASLNKQIKAGKTVEVVHMNESHHNAMLAELGNRIKSDIENIRLIAIAGPSSSGKTTFSTRLKIELMTKGLKPVMISLDDYYLDREQIQPDENGEVDLENINTLDIDLFSQNMLSLIRGEEVEIPHFDFKVGRRSGYKKLRIGEDSPIIIEGIHALNDALTSNIPKHQKFKIFISPQLQMNIDNHNPISITDLRLLRRIVRDKKFRNSPAIKTISMWPSVRRGEFRWIYPHQEGADYIFNSGLAYELCVMKKYAMPTLLEIDRNSEYFIAANRLIKFLKYFEEIDDKVVPCNSLLREFIGDSCFNV